MLAAILVPATSLLDWMGAPERALEFLVLRGIVSALALVGVFLTYQRPLRRHPVALGAGSPLLCALAIEVMILRLEGPASPYYAGLNLCILAVAVLYTWHWKQSLLVSGTIVAMWLLPALPPWLSGELSNQAFFNNLIFLIDTAAIAVASAVIRYRGAQREHRAREELADLSEELATALERLQENDRLKNEFFANISHELRTPLTLILSPVEDMLSRELPPGTKKSLTIVRRNAQRLLRLIDDLLDLARLDARGLRLNVARVDLTDLVERVAESARPAAEAHDIELVSEVGQNTVVFGDPHRLEIILTNLLGNAIKFTPADGSVHIRLWSDQAGVHVSVTDTGPGIAPEDLDRIFDRFYQVEGSEQRVKGGAGIGLPLAKSLAELHGGELTVSSKLGHGATFTLFLRLGSQHFKDEVLERRRVRADRHPGRRAEDRPHSEPPLAPADGAAPVPMEDEDKIRLARGRKACILVVEDEKDLRDFIVASLGPEFEVICATNGEQGLERVQRERPDLVLTDVMMPRMSGTELCRAIKSDRQLRNTPVILLTARSGTDPTLEGYSSGADDFVSKPFHTRVLLARVKAQLKLRSLGLQLVNQARLASASALAAGIAHEVKNPLNAVLNATRALAKIPADSPAGVKLLDTVQHGALRIADVVSVLEDQVRPADGAAKSICSIDAGVSSTLRLLEFKTGSIAVHYEPQREHNVVMSGRELNQVILNLLDNAAKAEPKNIWIDVEQVGELVRLHVKDDGPGIPRDIAPLVFEPFFTTRKDGEGTGLGLYLARRLVTEYGGDLRYRSRDGGGAHFTIELPAVR